MSNKAIIDAKVLNDMKKWPSKNLKYVLLGSIVNQAFFTCDKQREKRLELGVKNIFNQRGIKIPEFSDEDLELGIIGEKIIRCLGEPII